MTKPKLAIRVADAIEERIVAEGWRVGEMVGSEADLMAQHRVSRTVLREAILLLEARQVAVARRGPGGGLKVQLPQASTVSDAAARLLELEGMTAEHLHEARMAIEVMAVESIIRKLDEATILRIRAFTEPGRATTKIEKLAQLREFHGLLGELSANPVFKLVISVLMLVAKDFLITEEDEIPDAEVDQSLLKQGALVEAICEADFGLARARLKDFLDWVLRYAIPPASAPDHSPPGRSQ